MKLVSVTERNAAEHKDKLEGIGLIWKDGQVSKALVNGVLIETGYPGLNVSVPAPPTFEKKFKLSGEIVAGIGVDETFDAKYEAEARAAELERAFGYSLPRLKIEEIQVVVE